MSIDVHGKGVAGELFICDTRGKTSCLFVSIHPLVQNVQGMVSDAAFFRQWWSASGHMAQPLGGGLDTVDSFAARCLPAAAVRGGTASDPAAYPVADPDALVDLVFEAAWTRSLEPVLGEGAAGHAAAASRAPTEGAAAEGTPAEAAGPSLALSRPHRFFRAWTRWLLGQAALFARHEDCHLAGPIRCGSAGTRLEQC